MLLSFYINTSTLQTAGGRKFLGGLALYCCVSPVNADLLDSLRFLLDHFALAYLIYIFCCFSLPLNSVILRNNALLPCLCSSMLGCVYRRVASLCLSFFCLFVPTNFVFFPVSCHCHSDTRMYFARPSLEHADGYVQPDWLLKRKVCLKRSTFISLGHPLSNLIISVVS